MHPVNWPEVEKQFTRQRVEKAEDKLWRWYLRQGDRSYKNWKRTLKFIWVSPNPPRTYLDPLISGPWYGQPYEGLEYVWPSSKLEHEKPKGTFAEPCSPYYQPDDFELSLNYESV